MTESAKQGSAAWLFERVGKVTASRFCDVLAKLKNGASAKAREDYLWEVVIERITGAPTDHYTNAAMLWGLENELAARMRYEAETGAMVEAAGLIPHATLEGVAGSPDGLIGNDGGIEIKCPFNSAIHLRTVLDGMPEEHAAQVQGNMWVTARAWWDFVSFDPRLPPPLDLHVQRIERDEAYIAALAKEVALFLADTDALLARLQPTTEGRDA